MEPKGSPSSEEKPRQWPKSLVLRMESNLARVSRCWNNPLSPILKESNLLEASKEWLSDLSLKLIGEVELKSGDLGTESAKNELLLSLPDSLLAPGESTQIGFRLKPPESKKELCPVS